MNRQRNAVWSFFASVKLALITLFLLVATSIIGTVIEQKKEASFYIEEYGAAGARFIQSLSLQDMYGAWWFLALLALFALNLLVCSIERLPATWRLMFQDNLNADPDRLEKMNSTYRFDVALQPGPAADRMRQLLVGAGWKHPRRRDGDAASLLFVQKGVWTRLGVYVVHLSILLIFAGAIIGKVFGFKAYVFLPEGRSTSNVFIQGSGEAVPLGFELRCDGFQPLSFSEGGIQGERADLTVLDPALGSPLKKSIVVNDPLSHQGITFYKATSYPMEGYFVLIHDRKTGQEQGFRVPGEQDVTWPESTVSFRIADVRLDPDGVVQQANIQFSTGHGVDPADLWVSNNGIVNTDDTADAFSISFRQLYSTLVLATKDPGVWVVYCGSILMTAGLCVCFFLSHRRMWVCAQKGNRGSRIVVSGISNKNQQAFEHRFQGFVRAMEKELGGSSGKTTDPEKTLMPFSFSLLRFRRGRS